MDSPSALIAAPTEQAVRVQVYVFALALRAGTAALDAFALLENAHSDVLLCNDCL